MIEIKPIRSPEDYEIALSSIAELWGAPSGTQKGDQLDILATLVDAYERENFPIDAPNAETIEAFENEQQQLLDQIQGPPLKFEVTRDNARQFVFRATRGGEVIFTSEVFATKTDALQAIKLLQKNAAHSEIVDAAA